MKRFVTLCLSLLMVMGVAGAASAALTTFFDFDGNMAPDTELFVPNVGDTFTADVYVDISAEGGGGLSSAGVTVSFDNTQMSVLSTFVPVFPPTVGAPWTLLQASDFDNTAGTADIGGGVNGFGYDNTVLPLGTIEFLCIAEGVSGLSMVQLFPDFVNYDSFVLLDGTVRDDAVAYGSATVTQTPIPGSILLLGSGLVGLIGLVRRKRS